MFYYESNVDGRGYVESKVKLEKDMLVMIDDDIYNGDKEVFKVNGVFNKKGVYTVEMKFQKAMALEESETGNYIVDGKLYLVEGRLSKNQMLVVGNKVGKVSVIEKKKNEPDIVEMEWENIITVKSKYRVFKRSHSNVKVKEVYAVYNSWGEAFGAVVDARGSKGHEGYFHL